MRESLSEVKFNIGTAEGSPSLSMAIDFYEMCKNEGITVMGGRGRDEFIASVFGGGFLWLCIGKHERAFGRVSISENSVYDSPSISMGDFTEISYEEVRSLKKQPRIKEVYEKVGCSSFFDLSEPFNLQELYFDANGDEDKKSKILTELHLSQLFFRHSTIYRKVEKSIEWWDDIAEYVGNFSKTFSKVDMNEHGYLEIDASMSKEQWQDFARILLEQEGE